LTIQSQTSDVQTLISGAKGFIGLLNRTPSFRRITPITATLLLMLNIILPATATAVENRLVITMAQGKVNVKRSGTEAWASAAAGRQLESGDSVRTGYRSRAEISGPSGNIRLYENTVLIVPREKESNSGPGDFLLKLGAGIFQTKPSAPEPQFSVATNQVVVGIRTARATVVADEGTSAVASHSGSVIVTDVTGPLRISKVVEEGWKLSVVEPPVTRGGLVQPATVTVQPYENPDAWEEWDGSFSPDPAITDTGSDKLPF
jgi:hypothetical protein